MIDLHVCLKFMLHCIDLERCSLKFLKNVFVIRRDGNNRVSLGIYQLLIRLRL